MATCPMCNADVADDQMDQHKADTHKDEGQTAAPQNDQPAQ